MAGASPAATPGAAAPVLWMLLSALASASLGTLAHALGPYAGWQGGMLSRTFFGLVFSRAVARATGAEVVLVGPRHLWMRSLAGGASILLNFYAYTQLPVGDVLVLGNTAPIWFAAFAWRSLGHHPSRGEWAALGSGLLGVVLVTEPHLEQKNLAVLAAAFAGIASAVALHARSRLRYRYKPATILVHHAGAALVAAMLLSAGARRPLTFGGLAPSRAVPGLIMLGVLGTLGQYASTRALASGRAVRAAAASFAGVGFAVLFDRLFWPAPIDPRTLAGMALILLPLSWLVRLPEQGIAVRESAHEGPPLDLHGLGGAAVTESLERARGRTSCAIRIHVGGEGDRGAEAARAFEALGMDRTELRNGLLLHLSAGGRHAAIVADKGIAEIVPSPALERVCRAVLRDLAGGAAAGDAAARAIDALAEVLGEYFPARAARVASLGARG